MRPPMALFAAGHELSRLRRIAALSSF